MPYINQEKRQQVDHFIDDLRQTLASMEMDDEFNNMEGNVNYVITSLLMKIYGDKDSTDYSQINAAIGVLECAKSELYRKVAAPYEDQKEFDNGPIDATVTPSRTDQLNVEKYELPERYNEEEGNGC